ncbi:MAG: hypothetical protein K0R27_2480 [Xanthobacteraceae bacterium]|jgi:hypothetical protein|nr:hypothetical protein [Xanthobacteraceae bacterium]
MTIAYAAHRSTGRPCIFSAVYSALRGLRGDHDATDQAHGVSRAEHDATEGTTSAQSTLLPKWDVAEFLADSRAAQALARSRRPARRKSVDIDPQALQRAERMVASIHARSAAA